MKAITVTVETNNDEEMNLEFNDYKELVIWFATNKTLISDKEFDEIVDELSKLVVKDE